MKALRWGILGTASIAASFAEGVERSTNGRIAAIASRRLDKAQAWAAQFEVPRAFGSYEALLHSGEVDAVYIPLPNSLHAVWTLRALEAGLPVFCEKPLTATAGEAERVLAMSREKGLPVAEAFMYRFHPVYDRFFSLIEKGAIGDLVSLQATFTFLLDEPDSIVASAELAGGALLDVGCYPVNFARMVAGCEPVAVTAMMRGDEVDDTLLGLLRFPDGFLAQIECSIESFERTRAEVVGTAGSLLLESPWHPGDNSAQIVWSREGQREVIETAGANRFQLEAEDFARAILEGTPPRWTVEDAVGNMRVLDALIAAARKPVTIPVTG